MFLNKVTKKSISERLGQHILSEVDNPIKERRTIKDLHRKPKNKRYKTILKTTFNKSFQQRHQIIKYLISSKHSTNLVLVL